GRLSLRHFLAVEADEIYRIKQKRRKATIAHGGCDNLSRKRKQQPWAFDQYDRVQAFWWNVSNAKNAGKVQIETKQKGASSFCFAFKFDRHFDVAIGKRVCPDIDLNSDLRMLLTRSQRLRRVRILEGEIFNVLRPHGQLRRFLRRGLSRAAIRRHRHKSSLAPRTTCAAVG